MAPREANHPYPDQYLTVEYDATAMIMPHDTGPVENNETLDGANVDLEGLPMIPPPVTDNGMQGIQAAGADETSLDEDDGDGDEEEGDDDQSDGDYGVMAQQQPPGEVHLPSTAPLPTALSGDSATRMRNRQRTRGTRNAVHRNNTRPGHNVRLHRPYPNNLNMGNIGHDPIQSDVDPLSIDSTDPEEDDTWDRTHSIFVDAALAALQNTKHKETIQNDRYRAVTLSLSSLARRQVSSESHNMGIPSRRGSTVSPTPGDIQGTSSSRILRQNSSSQIRRALHRSSLSSVLDQSLLDDEQEDENMQVPELDTTVDTSTATTSAPNTPQNLTGWDTDSPSNGSDSTSSGNSAQQRPNGRFSFSPVRRLIRGERNMLNHQSSNQINVVTDEDNNASSFNLSDFAADIDPPPSPRRLTSGSSLLSNSSMAMMASNTTNSSGRSIRWTTAFESGLQSENIQDASSSMTTPSLSLGNMSAQGSTMSNSNQINFSFGSNTNVADLKYFAERGCIVHLLRSLDTPRLKTLGTRMLADYAKMPHRRVAVASNRRILEFCCRTMLEMPYTESMGTEWPAREYAVETIRSLTATEDSDSFLMGCTGLLKALAIVARGGPFFNPELNTVSRPRIARCDTTSRMGLVSGKSRLHACIAIMNLSCGKANKIEIASIPEVLESMRVIMISVPDDFSPATSSPPISSTSSNVTPKTVAEEARLKAATCIKNLSNADANDSSLLGANGLVEALAHVAVATCSKESGATHCTTNACLALMNLSISKANKHKVFKTRGVMDALMTVLSRTSPNRSIPQNNSNNEARVKACSALSNLAIGYENKIPMFGYEGFVDAILEVIKSDTGEARTKACSILWSFAAEMKNQVPVVRRGDILPTLVKVAEEDHSTEARFKCVAALTLLAESLENAVPLLESGALHPLMDILHAAGADPTQWKGQTASWCVGFLMNMAQSDDAAPFLRDEGVVELLAPLLTLDHYQSLKAAMAVTFICRFDKDDETYDLLRKTENVIPKIISLLHNTLSGRGGNGYKYGVFTLRSSVGCISSLASGPEFMKERIATKPVFDSLLRVVNDFCVDGGTKGAIVGGGRDDALSATLAIRALHSLIEYIIPIPGSSALPFGIVFDKKMMVALDSFGECYHNEVKDETRELAKDGYNRINCSLGLDQCTEDDSGSEGFTPRKSVANNFIENSIVASLVQGCCIGPSFPTGVEGGFFPSMIRQPPSQPIPTAEVSDVSDGNESSCGSTGSQENVRTFLLTDSRTGKLFAVPKDPSGGRAFNDGRRWCYRRGRYCRNGEVPDPNYLWTEEMQIAYTEALRSQRSSSLSVASGNSRGSSVQEGQPISSALLK